MEIPEPKRKWVGESIKRSEDPRFLTGRGQYIDDIQLPGLCHAACLRSPHAHARIKRIDTSKALALPGVLAVLTGQDCKRDTDPIGGPVRMYVLTPEKVRHVGEYVAAVVAESRYVAEDACDLIEVDYEVLPPVMDAEEAIKPGASLLHEEHGSNLLFHKVVTHGDVDKDFASADHVFKGRFHWTRSLGASLETYGAVASYNPSTGILDIWSGSQGYFFTIPASQALRLPKNRIRAHMVDIGGGFGNKLVSKGMILTGYLALKTGRPVKFIEDRIDNLSSNDGHGEERWHEIELAVTKEGIFKSLKMKLVEDQGAYCSWGGPIATLNALAQITGPYKIGSVRVDMAQAVTNKCGQSVYRGVGNAFYFSLERTVERAARALKMDVAEIRQKNFIQPDEFPYTIPTGNIYDSGNPPACLNKLLENAGYKKLREEQARLRKEGKYMGIGLASMQGRSVFSMVETWLHVDNPAFPLTSSPESTTIRVDGFGNFIVTLNFPTQGQAHETTIQQLVADEFSIEPGSISVVRPDSLNAAPTVAVGGSRSTAMLALAVRGAAKRLKEKMVRVGAHMLEISPEDATFEDGKVMARGVPEKAVTIPEIAVRSHFFTLSMPKGEETGLEVSFTADHPLQSLPDEEGRAIFYPIVGHSDTLAVVLVDPETGEVKIRDYFVVGDCGTQVNPMLVEGQIAGGIGQAAGHALWEELIYDETGQLLTTSYADYLCPTAAELPDYKIDKVETPSPYTPFGVKGVGESTSMPPAAAILNAVEDALLPLGVEINRVPTAPHHILSLIEGARK